MISRRAVLAVIISAVLIGGAGAYGAVAYAGSAARPAAHNPTTSRPTTDARIVFRNTTADSTYGLVSSVPLADPGSRRATTTVPCDRVYATTRYSMCLRIDRGVLTTFSANLLDSHDRTLRTWPLPGIPSRTRISADSKLIGFTAFVTAESYATVGFSTATEISTTDGTDYGNLEQFTLLVDGTQITAADRNMWGVTFTDDDNVFYATAASAGKTWLVRGDLATRTLTALRQNAE